METYGKCVVSQFLRQTRRVKRVLRDIFRFPMAVDSIVRWLPDVGAFGLLLLDTVLVPSEARKNASTAVMMDSCCRRTFQ